MEFKEQLPVWKAEGVAPPETKQNEGWQIGDKPPADWFNYMWSRTYYSLDEIREKVKQEVDSLKQSGVESNKILVDNLNSKGVIASTSDTIKVNVNKVKDIKLGSGNAKRTDVLQGKTYSSDEGTDLVGTMPNRGNLNKVILLDDYKDLEGKQTILNVPKGYYTGGKIEVEKTPDDASGSPGSCVLKIGTMDEGFFGEVSAGDFITGTALAQQVGYSQGSSHNSLVTWFKFAYGGKVLFIPQKTIRYNVSWKGLSEKSLVYGNKTIVVDGIKYKVRLIRGAKTDPTDSDSSSAKKSEWNRLILPLSSSVRNDEWQGSVESTLSDWGTDLSRDDLNVGSSDGSKTICQETERFKDDNIVTRGYTRPESFSIINKGATSSLHGWRPVLEVVQ